ncbi:protein disulfide isomerase-like 5-4 [Cynara cardunculus var. scolymus]|uniref:protein disulfide isomerase-like 5-4 n=1 Tax=Cynara cardunculus var. scolymus TaxID=59895 RepID=UPI000D62450F|nr:protein disulfide isomerase-like 5-4 [Cynara cardunculus var. scolymus]
MVLTSRIKSVDFFRKIPRDLTEASLSGAGLSIVAAISMMFLFGMELQNYMALTTTTSVIVDQSSDSEFLLIDFNMSFPALSCEFASLDVSDILGTNRLNITKTVRKYPIDKHFEATGSEYDPTPVPTIIKHDDKVDDQETGEGSVKLNAQDFDKISHQYPILVVNFFVPWCIWSNRLKPSWEKAARIIRQRHNPAGDGRILLGKVDCTEEIELCRSHHIQGYPSIRIFRKGSDVRDVHGHHEHESYYGDRDTDSLVEAMEQLVRPIELDSQKSSSKDGDGKTIVDAKRPAPRGGGCRIEGFVRVKKVPGNLVISARSESHSFDASLMNMSHIISNFTFGKKVTPRMMNDLRRLHHYTQTTHDKLSGKVYINVEDRANVTIEHYLQVVKTEVMSSSHQLIEDYEYTAHSSLVHAHTIPVAKFHFEPSPMQILVMENEKSFPHFITNICAIIGGIFTVAGILDSLLHNTMRLVKKIELGKNL